MSSMEQIKITETKTKAMHDELQRLKKTYDRLMDEEHLAHIKGTCER
mgnify:CR=1 FL=1